MMRLKKASQKKSEFVGTRFTVDELNKVKQRALLYCKGNISEFIRYCVLNYSISERDLENPDDIKKVKGHP